MQRLLLSVLIALTLPLHAYAGNVTRVDGGVDSLEITSADIADLTTSTVMANGTVRTKYLQSQLNDALSAGWISGYVISDAGGETVNVTTGEAFIRTSNSATAELKYHDDRLTGTYAISGGSVPTGATRYVVLNYNGGTPTVQLSATDTSNENSILLLGEAHNVGGTLALHNRQKKAGNGVNRVSKVLRDILEAANGAYALIHSGGIVTDANAPSRKLHVTATAGHDLISFDTIDLGVLDTSTSDTFTAVYRDGAGGFTRVSAQTDWANTQYDDNSGTLATMTASYWANLWVGLGYNGDMFVMYPQAEYSTQVAAEAESKPTQRPEEYDEHGFFVSRITFQKSAASPTTITDIRPRINSTTSVSGTSTHNDLGGLNAGDYKHLTAAEYAGTGTGIFAKQAAPTFTTGITTPAITLGATLITPTGTELNYVDGVTSPIQTQLDAKAADGANSDITSLSGLTTPLSVAQGGTGVASLPKFKVTKTTGQSVPASTASKVTFDSEIHDIGGYFDSTTNYRYIPLVAGYYNIMIGISWAWDNANTGSIVLRLRKNGVDVKTHLTSNSGTTAVAQSFGDEVQMNGTTDFLEVWFENQTASTVTIYGANTSVSPTTFVGHLIP